MELAPKGSAFAFARRGSCAVALCVAALLPSAASAARGGELPFQRLIERTALRHDLDPQLLAALVEVESARRADAVSPKGARGLAQLMPATARRLKVKDPHDPEENLDGAARYLKWLIRRYGGDLELALAAYNAGEGAVDRRGGIPNYPETISYVRNVLKRAGGPAQLREDRPEEVRVVRRNGSILITNRD